MIYIIYISFNYIFSYLNMAKSSRAIWDGPSSPMETPQWEPATFKFVWEMTPIRKLSKARVRKHANVEMKATERSLSR